MVKLIFQINRQGRVPSATVANGHVTAIISQYCKPSINGISATAVRPLSVAVGQTSARVVNHSGHGADIGLTSAPLAIVEKDVDDDENGVVAAAVVDVNRATVTTVTSMETTIVTIPHATQSATTTVPIGADDTSNASAARLR